MTEQEHLQVAHGLNEIADRLDQDDNGVAAAEMLWGAVNRVLSAIAIKHRLDSDGRPPRRGAVMHYLVNGRLVDRNIQRGMYAAGELHGHFYNSHLAPAELTERVADTKSFIADLLNLYHQHARR